VVNCWGTHCYGTNISLGGRDELYRHIKVADLYGPLPCTCPGTCGEGVDSPGTQLDYVRVFTRTFDGSWRWCDNITTPATVYVLDMFPICPSQAWLPTHPISNSNTVRVVIRFDPSNGFVPLVNVGRYPRDVPEGVQYEVILLPKTTPLPHVDSRWFYTKIGAASGTQFLEDLLWSLVTMLQTAEASSVRIVGFESLPADWFQPPIREPPADGDTTGLLEECAYEMHWEMLVAAQLVPPDEESFFTTFVCQRSSEYAQAHGCDSLEEVDFLRRL
jgi:hypothetical protein